MQKRHDIEKALKDHGFEDFRWIRPKDIEIRHWVRMKCRFGCPIYGKNASCPPATPSISECREFAREYEEAVIIHASGVHPDNARRKAWTKELNGNLVKAERDVFKSGRYKAFVLFLDDCSFCATCAPSRINCNRAADSRPSCEAMGVDVFATARKAGYPIDVLTSKDESMNRYAILLVE